MAWVRIDDQFPEHPKILRAGLTAMGLFVASLCYCNRHLTDGFIPAEAIKILRGTKKIRQILVENGLWIECSGGYQIHDYLNYQRSRDEVVLNRAGTRERVAKHRRSNADVTPLHYRNTSVSNGDVTPLPIPSQSHPPSSKNQKVVRATEIDDEFVTRMVGRFGSVLGGRSGILERIEEAKGHKAWIGWTDKQAGVRGWLRRDAERVPSGNGVAHRAPNVRTSEDVEMDKAVAEGFRSGRIRDGEPIKLGDILKRSQGGGA